MDSEDKNTRVSLREHIESRLAALEKATDLAAKALEKRLEGMNEFREALNNQASQFMTRREMTVIKDAFVKDIRELREFKAALEGKASQTSVIITLVISILGLLVAIISLLYA